MISPPRSRANQDRLWVQDKKTSAVVGVGLPGCGKTTILKPLAKKQGLIYINADDIRLELTGDARNHSKETEVWQLLFERVRQALEGPGVVIDATHTKPKDRKQVTAFCRSNGAEKIVGYWIKAPIDVCTRRNEARERKVPKEALAKMENRLNINPPKIEEGFDEIKVVKNY